MGKPVLVVMEVWPRESRAPLSVSGGKAVERPQSMSRQHSRREVVVLWFPSSCQHCIRICRKEATRRMHQQKGPKLLPLRVWIPRDLYRCSRLDHYHWSEQAPISCHCTRRLLVVVRVVVVVESPGCQPGHCCPHHLHTCSCPRRS